MILLFLVADFFLKISPGPDMAQVLGRGLTQGWKPAWECVLGVGAAGLIQVPAASFGLAATFSSSELLFQLVRYAGVFYLTYIGVSAVRRSFQSLSSVEFQQSPECRQSAFWQGFGTNLLNPKVFVFMVAFLPQFVQPQNGPVWLQILILGSLMKINGVVFLGACALAANRVRGWVASNKWFLRLQDGILGLLMISLALYILFSDSMAPPGHKLSVQP